MRDVHPGVVAVLIAAMVLLVWWYHGRYIRECVASGNTRGYCEMNFWKR